MKHMTTTYTAAARALRACRTVGEIDKREEANERLFLNGLLTASEYGRLCVREMDGFFALSETLEVAK